MAAGALHSWEQTDTKPDEPRLSPADFRDEKHQSRVLPGQISFKKARTPTAFILSPELMRQRDW